MSNFPSLQIDYWIYTIGDRGGLYHQSVNKEGKPQGEIKRIHNSHPPIEHRTLVKEWQDKYLNEKGLVLPKRYNPKNPKTPVVKTLENKSIAIELKSSKKKPSHKKKSSEKKQIRISKVSKKKSNNLSEKQIELLLAEPKQEQIVCDEKTRKCILIPSSKEFVFENTNKLTRINNKFLPEWVSLNLSEYTTQNSNTQIYYSNDIDIEQAKTYGTERLLSEDNTTNMQMLGFTESYYCSKESLNPLKGLLGFYCDADVSFDEGKTKHKLHIYQAAEPKVKKDFRPIYEQIFAKMFLCAITNKNINNICLQIDNCINDKEAMDEICIALLAILRNVKTITLHFISTTNEQCYNSIKTEFATKIFKNLEEAVKSEDLTNTMFASLCDMRFVLSKSVFSNVSSLPLHIYGLTNNSFLHEETFVIH